MANELSDVLHAVLFRHQPAHHKLANAVAVHVTPRNAGLLAHAAQDQIDRIGTNRTLSVVVRGREQPFVGFAQMVFNVIAHHGPCGFAETEVAHHQPLLHCGGRRQRITGHRVVYGVHGQPTDGAAPETRFGHDAKQHTVSHVALGNPEDGIHLRLCKMIPCRRNGQ